MSFNMISPSGLDGQRNIHGNGLDVLGAAGEQKLAAGLLSPGTGGPIIGVDGDPASVVDYDPVPLTIGGHIARVHPGQGADGERPVLATVRAP